MESQSDHISGKAVKSLELSFGEGVSVAHKMKKAKPDLERCPPSKDPTMPCSCGLQYQTYMFRSEGTVTHISTGSGGCLGKPTNYDVTAPQTTQDGDLIVNWRPCRSNQNVCEEVKAYPRCDDGV